MVVQKLLIILLVDHICRGYDHIILVHAVDDVEILHIGGDVVVIDGAGAVLLGEEYLHLAALGVDVEVPAAPHMLYDGAGA